MNKRMDDDGTGRLGQDKMVVQPSTKKTIPTGDIDDRLICERRHVNNSKKVIKFLVC